MFQDFLEIPLPREWWTVLFLVWAVVWKGIALWKAARLGQKWWFVGMLIVNTFGVLEIFYIYVFSQKREMQRRDRRNEDLANKESGVHAHTTAATFLDNEEPVAEEKEKMEKAQTAQTQPVAPTEPKKDETVKIEESKPSESSGHIA